MAKLQAYSLIFLMLFVASIPLHGQYSFEDTIPIDEVLIKAKIANNQHAAGFVTQRIDTLEMMQKITGSLSELLAESTPVFIKSQVRGASATASMRGAGASHTKVLWNNVPINSPLTGQVDFSLLPVYFTDELELFYGSASLQNSNGALGGSVAINNTPDWSKGVSANVMKQIGQFGTYGTFAQANIGNGTINFRNRFFVEQTENNYPYYFKANRTGEISGYRKLENANYTKWGNLSELNLRVNAKSIAGAKFWVQKSKRNIPALINSSALNHDENQQDYNLKILTFYKHYGTRFSWEIQSAFILDELNYYLINQVNEQVASDSHFDASNQYKSNISSFIGTYTTTNHWRISVQFETKFDWVYVENKKTIQGYKENQDAVSGMFALHKNFGERWFFSALLRQQWINSEWINPIPSIGAEYLLSKRLETKLKANVARNYHAPSLNDLYYLPGGNASLMPEQGTTFDVSVSQNTTNGAWQFSHALNGYYSVIKNWIQWTPSQFEYWMPVNKSEVHARGIEYNNTLAYKLENLFFKMRLQYAYSPTTNQSGDLSEHDASKGQQLIYIPKHTGSVWFNMAFKNFDINWMTYYLGQRQTSTVADQLFFPEPSFWLTHLSVGTNWEFKPIKVSVKFKIDNLFNAEYANIKDRPMPLRNYAVMLKFDIK